MYYNTHYKNRFCIRRNNSKKKINITQYTFRFCVHGLGLSQEYARMNPLQRIVVIHVVVGMSHRDGVNISTFKRYRTAFKANCYIHFKYIME